MDGRKHVGGFESGGLIFWMVLGVGCFGKIRLDWLVWRDFFKESGAFLGEDFLQEYFWSICLVNLVKACEKDGRQEAR